MNSENRTTEYRLRDDQGVKEREQRDPADGLAGGGGEPAEFHGHGLDERAELEEERAQGLRDS